MTQFTRVMMFAGLAMIVAAPLQAAGRFGCFKKRAKNNCCVSAPPVACCQAHVVAHEPVVAAPCCGASSHIAAPSVQANPSHISVSPTAPAAPAPSWNEAWGAVKAHASAKGLTICDLKKAIGTDFTTLIDSLGGEQKHVEGEFTVCFPNEATWNARPDLQAQIVASLRNAGIL